MIEYDIIYSVHALLKQMQSDTDSPVSGYNLAWSAVQTQDLHLDPIPPTEQVDMLGRMDDVLRDDKQAVEGDRADAQLLEDNTPLLQIFYGLAGAQDRGLQEYLGFPDYPSLGVLREMTPILLRILLFDNRSDQFLTRQIAMAREDIRKAIGDNLREGKLPPLDFLNGDKARGRYTYTDDNEQEQEAFVYPEITAAEKTRIEDNLKKNVFQAWVGEYYDAIDAAGAYTDTADFLIPVQVWWRYEQRAVDREDTASLQNPRLPKLEIAHTLATREETRETLDGDENYTVIDTGVVTATFELSGSAELRVIKDGTRDDNPITSPWTDSSWTFDTVYEFEVTDGAAVSKTPELRYPFYPSMLPESKYDIGSSPEQGIERRIRQEIEKRIQINKQSLVTPSSYTPRFVGIKTTASGPLSLKYTRPDKLPLICVEFKKSSIGFRTKNARDQQLECCAYIYASADRVDSDPYDNVRIIDNALADLRVLLIETEGLEGVSNAYEVTIGDVMFPRQAQDVGGDLLFMGSINFNYGYRPGR